jgi:hypothetical protein
MKDLNNLELSTINGGEDGDFAKFHGYVTGKLLRSFQSIIIPYPLYEFYQNNF